jgi:hypothetical protein
MKIRSVAANSRKRAFELTTRLGGYSMPYARLRLQPSPDDPVAWVVVDPELGGEAFTYRLGSGAEDSVHLDAVLEYHRDPTLLSDLLLYELTLEAQKRMDRCGLAKREVIRRLHTSPSQLYRLLDPTNRAKSIDQMVKLLQVLDCDVELVVRERSR